MVVCSSPGGATDCTRLGLAWVVSARPRSPRSMGAERDSRSASWLWTCSKAGEAGLKGKKKKKPKASRQLRPSACKSEPASLRGEGTLFVVRSRWRTAKRPELRMRKRGGKEKGASELSNSAGSAKSKSCGSLGCEHAMKKY
ncbi:uncharacterized protein LOC126045986 isoform X2 [Accipiter gentilis]|uniref:uncharacterized protein LOC126045986 isoform X2 n=1 Tax=Astur gentilis TaxID=8957 RepID=UPI002110C23D|nr:uncharacterized protein LOC126045986 isoform X2 [Accipiter gentilis]